MSYAISITEDHIVKAVDYIESLNDKEVSDFFTDFGKKQPVLLAYAGAMSDQLGKEESREMLFFFAAVTWKAFNNTGSIITEVPEYKLAQLEESLQKSFTDMGNGNENTFPDGGNLHHQPVLLSYIFNELASGVKSGMTEHAAEQPFDSMDPDRTILLFTLLILISCLNSAISGPRIEVVQR